MANIKKRELKNGTEWRIQVMRTINGRKERKNFSCHREEDIAMMAAEAAVWQRAGKVDPEGWSALRDLTVEKASRQYIELRRPVISPSTVIGYEKILRDYLADISAVRLGDLTTVRVQILVNSWVEQGLSPKTIQNAHGFLHAVIKEFAPDKRLATRLPQRERPELYIPSDDEVKKLISVVKGSDLEVPVLLAAFGPLRRGEICALKAEDVNEGVIHVHKALVRTREGKWVEKPPKTRAGDRYVRLPEEVAQKLPSSGKMTSLTPDRITELFGKVVRNTDGLKPFRFHDLRHYCASVMHSQGIPDAYIIQRGGWETDKIMKAIYRHALSQVASETDNKINGHFSSLFA